MPSTFGEALEQPLTQILDGLRNLLERTPAELSADIAERGLTLVGGGALLRGLDELIRRRTGLRVTIDDEPLTTVARGAGKALEELETIHPRITCRISSVTAALQVAAFDALPAAGSEESDRSGRRGT